jgi:hypothetical protein
MRLQLPIQLALTIPVDQTSATVEEFRSALSGQLGIFKSIAAISLAGNGSDSITLDITLEQLIYFGPALGRGGPGISVRGPSV